MRLSPSTPGPAVRKEGHPEDPWLREVIAEDYLASAAWKRIVQLGVDAKGLETLLLELRSSEAPTAGFRPLSRKECTRAIKRIERVAQEIGRLGIEFSDLLPGPAPPLNTRLGRLLLRVPPGSQALLLHDWLLNFVRPIKQVLEEPSLSEQRARFPDRVHTIGAEIVHLCVVASSCAGLDLERTTREGPRSPDPVAAKIGRKKWLGLPQYCYEYVSNLLNAVLAAEGLERTVDARSLRRAYSGLHPRLSAVLKSKHRVRKETPRHKTA